MTAKLAQNYGGLDALHAIQQCVLVVSKATLDHTELRQFASIAGLSLNVQAALLDQYAHHALQVITLTIQQVHLFLFRNTSLLTLLEYY